MGPKNQISVTEFRKLMGNGKITVGTKGRLMMDDELPEHNIPPSKQGFMFNPADFIFIPGRVYSSKNTHQIRIKQVAKSNWKCLIKNKGWVPVKPFVAKNDKAAGYQKKKVPIYLANTDRFRAMYEGQGFPIRVEFIFIMPDKAGWDWNNITQLVQDCMVDAGWLPDDSVHYMIPSAPEKPKFAYYIDKNKPGVFIRII